MDTIYNTTMPQAGTTEARDLKLTVETLKCKEEGKLDVETGLVKKVSSFKQERPLFLYHLDTCPIVDGFTLDGICFSHQVLNR